MPTIYLNDGLRIVLNTKERGHNKRHVHVYYKGDDCSFDFEGNQLNGPKLPRKIEKEIKLYLVNHKDYLNQLWEEFN